MANDRQGSIALVVGSVGMLVTMGLHPSSHDLLTAGDRFTSVAAVTVGVHALAIASLGALFLGAFAFSRRLSTARHLAPSALVAFGLAVVAGLGAATASGFVGTGLVREILAAEPGAAEGWRLLLGYNGRLNQAFAQVFVMASSVAVTLWSAALVSDRGLPRALGLYGLLMSALLALALASGHLTLGVHGFGLVTLAQAVWFVGAGVLSWRPAEA